MLTICLASTKTGKEILHFTLYFSHAHDITVCYLLVTFVLFGHHFVSLENHNQLMVRLSLLRKTSAYFYQNSLLVVYDYEKIFEFVLNLIVFLEDTK